MLYAVPGREPRPRRPAGFARRLACVAAVAGAAGCAGSPGGGDDALVLGLAVVSPPAFEGGAATVQFDEHGDPVDKRFTMGVIQGGEIALPEADR